MPSEAVIRGGGAVKDVTTASFQAEVIDGSFDAPVIVDFWAPWCGPCRTLGPILERVVRAARGAVRLVKINIDENREIAQQMRIQSIPAVYAFRDGRPIDGFVGALSEGQVKRSSSVSPAAAAGSSPIDEALAMAKQSLQEGDHKTAATLYTQVLQHDREKSWSHRWAGAGDDLAAGNPARPAKPSTACRRSTRAGRDRRRPRRARPRRSGQRGPFSGGQTARPAGAEPR